MALNLDSNLRTRLITAVVLLLVFFLALFAFPAKFSALFFMLIVVIAAYEWAQFIYSEVKKKVLFSTLIALICMMLWQLPSSSYPVIFMVVCICWIWQFALLFSRPVINKSFHLIAAFIVLPGAWLGFWYLYQKGPLWLILGACVVWLADSIAYVGGRMWGKRKLAPSISPGKTIEGALCGIAAVFTLALISSFLLPIKSTVIWIVMMTCLGAISIMGDLYESRLKRQSDIKDSGTILPGHGGVLDRTDALIAVLPFVSLLFIWQLN